MLSYLSKKVSILKGGKFKKCFLSSNGRSNGSSIVLRRGETGWGWNERVKRGRCSFRRGLLTRILLESRGNGIGRMNRVGRTSEIIALPPFRRTYLFTLNNDEWTRGLGSSPDHLYLCFWPRLARNRGPGGVCATRSLDIFFVQFSPHDPRRLSEQCLCKTVAFVPMKMHRDEGKLIRDWRGWIVWCDNVICYRSELVLVEKLSILFIHCCILSK